MKKLTLVAVLIVMSGICVRAEVCTTADRINLAGEWSLRQADDSASPAVPMDIPGGVHSALFKAGRIPDPFFGQNELKTQWVGQKDWVVERTFDVPETLLRHKAVVLRLEDVDTFCEISVNGKLIGKTGNRFRRYEFDLKPELRVGNNRITAVFRSSEEESKRRAELLSHEIPLCDNGLVPNINLIRKPTCHGGWDWGLSQMITGFCGKTEIIAYDTACIDYVTCDQQHTPGLCMVVVNVEVTSPSGGETTLAVELGELKRERPVTLTPGKNCVSVTLPVQNPKLWWPNGYGESALYPLRVRVGESFLQRKIGLRSLEVVNKKDRYDDKDGMSMIFRVNGVDVFCKGANWIPCDAFQNRQTFERYNDLLSSAADANMNMVRLWGGGQFENDCFYELCDEKGLLIWHDFMFSCSLYPADKEFLGEVKAELNHQLRRLRDHASIAIWCGDNECIGALGWFDSSRRNRDMYLIAYDRLNNMMSEIVAELDPTRIFWPSSPCAGPGDFSDGWHNDAKGDMHYWTVWHENKNFSAYYNIKPRFCSEFGYQSLSSPEVAATFCSPDQLNPTAPDFEYHQKNVGGNTRILETMSRYFRFPQGTENILYLSQVQQAMAIKTAVEAWRHLQPRCMGTLFWQLNDNWPVASWSSIEYGGKWKHLQYHAKRFYAPLAVMAVPSGRKGDKKPKTVPDGELGDDDEIEIWAVNDANQAVLSDIQCTVWTFGGKKAAVRNYAYQLPPRSATLLRTCQGSEFGNVGERVDRFLGLEINATVNGVKTKYRNEYMFNYYKRCPIETARVDASVADRNGKWTVTLTTDKPAFFVWANATGIRGEFSDNSFTLYPGSPVTLTFTPKGDCTFDQFKAALQVKHLRQTY